jgi:hypothetical protein
MPPRGVTAETVSADWTRRTGSSGSRENSAMAPKVPRLHCVSGLAISRCSRSMAAALIEAIGTEAVQA